jgi:hypothetical protein
VGEHVVGIGGDVHEVVERRLEVHPVDLWLERFLQSPKLVLQRGHGEIVAL